MIPLGLFFTISLAQTQAGPSIDFAKAWQETASAIELSYYGRVSRREEMETRLKQYAEPASKATSKEEFRAVVDKMIGEFKDSHFDLLTDEDQGYYLMDALMNGKKAAEMPELGAWFKQTSAGYVVQMVLDGSEAEKADLRKGDLVQSIDGHPFSPIESLKPDVGKAAELQVKRGGQLLNKRVGVGSMNALGMFLTATKASARVIDEGGKKVGYMHLWTQATDDFKNEVANEVYGKLSHTDAFILDLRDGFGGRPEGYGDPFFRPEVKLDWIYLKSAMHELYGYGRPLVVLINGGSRSAKEVLSFIFKKSGRATLIGSNTAGNVLGTVPRRLNQWAYLEVPVMDVQADGVRLEGRGVAPDIAVPQEFDSLGRDLYLDSALKFLGKRVSSR